MSLSMKQLYLQKVLTADAQQCTQTTKKDNRFKKKNAQRWKEFHKVEIISAFFFAQIPVRLCNQNGNRFKT